jgi:serine/threonine protein kinase/Tfp pilus assembly protein PilF
MVCLLRVGIGSEDPGAASPGNRFGVYSIERRDDGSLHELGRGAMGVTYRAIDTSLQRKVALKIIKTDLAARSGEARERFMREARAAAALRHENVATVYQFGVREETGQCFYAMELIEGETLEERVRRTGPLDLGTAVAISRQVAAALSAAEKRGLIHRDLKPANLMLVEPDAEDQTRDRHRKQRAPLVRIIDFGLAKAITDESDPMAITRDGFVGTPAFASPEQFSHAPLDARSDIYSLGLTLWYALTGRTPFPGRDIDAIRQAQMSEHLPIEQLTTARVSSQLIALIESMLSVVPAARPGTQQLAARLERLSAQANRKWMPFALAGGIFLVGVLAFLAQSSLRKGKAGLDQHTAAAEATSNPAAYEAYLKGVYFWDKRTSDGFREAEKYLNQTIALDPKYAQAYAALGDVYQFMSSDPASRAQDYAKSEAANRKALELDPSLAQAHASLGLAAMNYDWDWAGAEREFKRAIELNPNYATVHHWYAEFLACTGRFDESFREMNRARELDPLSLVINNDSGKDFLFGRRFDQAETQLRETLKMDPNFELSHYWLAWTYATHKRYKEALVEFKELERFGATASNLAGFGYVQGMTGRKSEAEQTLDALKHAHPEDFIQTAYLCIGLGDNDQALAYLEKEYQARSTGVTSLKVFAVYDPLRSDPRFADLLRRVHLDR